MFKVLVVAHSFRTIEYLKHHFKTHHYIELVDLSNGGVMVELDISGRTLDAILLRNLKENKLNFKLYKFGKEYNSEETEPIDLSPRTKEEAEKYNKQFEDEWNQNFQSKIEDVTPPGPLRSIFDL